MDQAIEDFEGTVSIGGRNISNLRFADDIDVIVGSEEELRNLLERMHNSASAFGMEISGKKTKLMTNNINGISNNITIGSETLEEVNRFKYLGSIISDEGSKKEILSRIAQTSAAMVKLKPIWNDRQI